MNKQRILELTGMSEDQFYDAYPDKESFCNDYPEACAQLEQAQGGMQTYNREQPLDVISPLVARYTLPKGMVDNSKPIEKMAVPRQVMSPKQTMYNVGSTGTSYITPIDTEYKNGGNWIKKAIKHPGRCTPGSPNYDCPKGSPQWNLAQTFKKHHGFHKKGGELEEYKGGSQVNYNLPTTQDSLNVMNSQLKLNQFYDNERKLGRLILKDKIPFREMYDSNTLNNKNLEFYREVIRRRQDYNDSGWDEQYKKLFNLSPSDVSRLEYQGLGKTKSGNNNVQYYRDLITPMQNLASPFAMYDNRIKPQNMISYEPPKYRGGHLTDYPGGAVLVYDYDPIVVKPAAMKTQADWLYIKKNYPKLYKELYATTTTISKDKPNKPTHPVHNLKRLSISNKYLDEPNIQMQGRTIPLLEMRLPQQGNIPFYGPGNTIVGYTDDDRQFYPAQQYTGAPRNEINLQDKKLLDNLELLKEYIRRRDTYKFDNFELGGTSIHPAMRTNFKHGGYYGMDGKFHPNYDSGTYVGGAGYYFEPGGTTVTPSTPPGAGGDSVDITGQSSPSTPPGAGGDSVFASNQEAWKKDDVNGGYFINPDYDPTFGEDDDNNKQFGEDADEKNIKDYDASMYSSEIDPNTGFRKWSYNNQEIRNIKKDNPALWEHLKEEGHGARWETGQTDIQKVGRTAGAVGRGLENAVNVAGAIGNYLSNRKKQQNLDKSAMNKGSTASMFTNPEGSSKGDYGVTGSAYGMFKPNQTGNYSFKGMYGKYGMQVPKYAVGGYTPDLSTISDYGLEEKPELEFRNFNMLTPFIPPAPLIISPADNTRVATQRFNTTRNDIPSGIIDADLALQAVAGIESSSKPGKTKVGMQTKLVGKTGKGATASGTYQITEPTLKDIYNNNSNFNKTFKNFNEFKLAFDSNPEVEYAAAKSLMLNHIKNYGIYALGAWYQPSFAKRAMKGDKSVYDIIPSKDEYGNKKTWGQDFKEKLNAYNKIAGTSYNINSSISTKSPSVNIKNLHPNLMQFTNTISQTFPGLVLTSGNDSKHMKGSKHYNNKAIDIGANSSNKKEYLNLKSYLKNNPSIKKQYGIENIIDEGDHLHIELMKKGGQFGGQVVEMDENEIQQFLKAGGQLEFID